MHTRLARVLIAGVSLASAYSARADITGFGNFSEWTINQGDDGPAPMLLDNGIRLTYLNDVLQQTRSIWHETPQTVSAFAASFTYQALNGATGSGFGAALVLQNDPDGIHALGASPGDECGYDGIGDSVAVTLELGLPSRSGLYTDGLFGGGSPSISPVDLRAGNPVLVSLQYDGSILGVSILDTVTLDSYDAAYAVDIPAIVGSSTALVGFTASTGFGSSADQYIFNPQFTSIPEPGSLALLTLLGATGVRRRRT